jgi:hypothetical protein
MQNSVGSGAGSGNIAGISWKQGFKQHNMISHSQSSLS